MFLTQVFMVHLLNGLNEVLQLLVGPEALPLKGCPTLGTVEYPLHCPTALVFHDAHYAQVAVAVPTVNAHGLNHHFQADTAGDFLLHLLGSCA